jgi:uncharacterized protein (DUF58 family)
MNKQHLEIIKLNNLFLAAKIISEQLKQGTHLGKRVGPGAEFEQYRHYEPGDDLKRIDWKLFARSERYQIKESPIESNLYIRLMLDLSGSMNYHEDGIYRLAYAKILLASLAYMGFQQGDTLSLYFLKDGKVEQVVAPGGKSFHHILYHLEKAKASGIWDIQKEQFPQMKTKQKELVVLVSDFLQQESEWESVVQEMHHPRKDIALFQILGQQEIRMELKGNIRFEDLETGRTINAEAGQLQKSYNEQISSYLDRLEKSFRLSQVRYMKATLDEPVAQLINRYLDIKQVG